MIFVFVNITVMFILRALFSFEAGFQWILIYLFKLRLKVENQNPRVLNDNARVNGHSYDYVHIGH